MTIKQIQLLLLYLGYSPGDPDGLDGPTTRTAVKEFQQEFGELSVDGDAGDLTCTALRNAVWEGWKRPEPTEENVTVTENATVTGTFWDEIEYFERKEFRCPCGKCGGFPVEPKEALVRAVDKMRRDFGAAVIIVPPDGHSGGSGVRCQTYNDSLSGSVSNSRHVQGKAVDFQAPGKSTSTVETYLAKLQATGTIRYWYRISTGSWHMDIL